MRENLIHHSYKYIHLLLHPDREGIFFPALVEMFADIENGFDISEHCFVAVYRSLYEKIQDYPNVYYFESINAKGPTAQIVNSLASCGNWIFLHCGLIPSEIVKIKKNYLRKIIWRTWGHDTQINYWKKHKIRNCLKKLFLVPIWVRTVRRFKAVGVANLVDEIAVHKRFGEVHTARITYPKKTKHFDCESASDSGDYYRIMIGHSGFPNDHHEIIINSLEKWRNKNVKLYLPVAYGDKQYIGTLKDKFVKLWGEKICFVEGMMDLDHYRGFIKSMDIVILDGVKSYALGNLSIALSFRKKIFLNRNGIIKQAFDVEQLPYSCTDEIEEMQFDEFVMPKPYPDPFESSLLPKGYKKDVENWHSLLNWLSNEQQ